MVAREEGGLIHCPRNEEQHSKLPPAGQKGVRPIC